MLPRQNRLKDQADFDKIFKNGRKISTPLFLLAYINRDDQKPTRVGVVAGKKVGGAVQRNRAKRLLRQAANPFITRHITGFDFVLVANANTITADLNTLNKILFNIFEE